MPLVKTYCDVITIVDINITTISKWFQEIQFYGLCPSELFPCVQKPYLITITKWKMFPAILISTLWYSWITSLNLIFNFKILYYMPNTNLKELHAKKSWPSNYFLSTVPILGHKFPFCKWVHSRLITTRLNFKRVKMKQRSR